MNVLLRSSCVRRQNSNFNCFHLYSWWLTILLLDQVTISLDHNTHVSTKFSIQGFMQIYINIKRFDFVSKFILSFFHWNYDKIPNFINWITKFLVVFICPSVCLSTCWPKPCRHRWHRESQSHPQNIMYDKRVVRGSNYSHIHMQAVSETISKTLNLFSLYLTRQMKKKYINSQTKNSLNYFRSIFTHMNIFWHTFHPIQK